jgi:hypothetical protein
MGAQWLRNVGRIGRHTIWPEYDRYQAKSKRDIPVVVLEQLETG